MSAVAGFPDLSGLLAWPTDHLMAAADHWEAIGARSYGVANQVWRDALAVDWQGDGADALRMATHADMLTTSAAADQLQAAAKVARSGAADLFAGRSRLRHAIQDANAAGFDVREDMSVTDRSTGSTPALRAAREAHAQTFAADIRQRAVQLLGLDEQVAAKVTAAVAGIRDTFPRDTGTSRDSKAQAVDDHSFKQDPPPGPPGNPFAGWTEEQKAQVAAEIAQGHAWEQHKGDFPGMSQQDLARWIYNTMNDPNSQVGTSLKSGGVVLLRDGKVVFIDPNNPDYGTAYRPLPTPTSKWRTPLEYFDQQTRALEPLPPPAPGRLPPVTPGELAPPAPAPQAPSAHREAPPPPVESQPPPAKGGRGPAFGGGPATPFGPRLEPPPHAGHHHPPVLGDLDPDPWDHGE